MNRKAYLESVVSEIDAGEYTFEIRDKGGNPDEMFLMAHYPEADIISREVATQTTRKWYISPHATKSEVVQTAFKCIITSMEHRAREMFKYRGKRVFGPHFDVDVLWNVCNDGNHISKRD